MSGQVLACSRCGAEVPVESRTCPTCGALIIAVVHVPGTREGTAEFQPFPEPIAAMGTVKRAEQDIRMMKSPQYWPNSILPLKRARDGHIECGVWDGAQFYMDTMLFQALHAGPDASKAVGVTPEELVGAGWTVD